jgi:uncharacterized membrane protein YcfT
MPLFCFFAGYNLRKPRKEILIAAIVLQISTFSINSSLNILFTIFIGQTILTYLNIRSNQYLKWIVLILCSGLSFTSISIEYKLLPIIFMLTGKLKKRHEKYKLYLIACLIIYGIYNQTIFSFEINYLILMMILFMITCVFLTKKNFDTSVNLNLRPISRNSLYIYVTHLILFNIMKNVI